MIRQAWGQSTRRVGTRSAPGRAGRVEIGADLGEVGDVTRAHAGEGRLAAERAVGAFDPTIGLTRVGVEDLQSFVDAGDVADAAQRVRGNAHGVARAPGVVGSGGGVAEEDTGFLGGDSPGVGDVEEAAEGEDGVDSGRGGAGGGFDGQHGAGSCFADNGGWGANLQGL